MQRTLLKSKIHRAVVTDACLQYSGSITIDKDLMDAADLVTFEQVYVYNTHNGERFSTYVIEGDRGSGAICLNGAAARKASVGDLVIVCSYASYDKSEWGDHTPVGVYVTNYNKTYERRDMWNGTCDN
jgi:aspartate 1-decarboxylase